MVQALMKVKYQPCCFSFDVVVQYTDFFWYIHSELVFRLYFKKITSNCMIIKGSNEYVHKAKI